MLKEWSGVRIRLKPGRPEEAARATSPPFRSTPMTLAETISADYTLRPSELAEVLVTMVKARQPTLVWGPPGAAKSMIARQVAQRPRLQLCRHPRAAARSVDLKGIPWRDEDGRTRWAPPGFLDVTAGIAAAGGRGPGAVPYWPRPASQSDGSTFGSFSHFTASSLWNFSLA